MLVEGQRIALDGVQFAGLRLALRADERFDIRHLEQIAKLGGIQNIRRANHDLIAGERIFQGNGAYAVAIAFGADRDMAEQDIKLAAGAVGREHGFDDRQANARLMAEAADIALARVPVHGLPRLVRQGIIAAVIIADAIREAHVAGCGAALINPGVLIGRDSLGGKLAADPVGFFAHDDGFAHAQGCQCRADRARAAADDEDIAVSFFHAGFLNRRIL